MTLYHGTNIEFSEIDIEKCLPYKDFGRGLYLTDIREQAERMALRKSRLGGAPIVQEYFIAEDVMASCNVLRFEKPTEEWAKFILANREHRVPPFEHSYDIVIGPVADDGVAYILNRYLEGSFTITDVVKELQYKQLSSQYCFCTPRAAKLLQRI